MHGKLAPTPDKSPSWNSAFVFKFQGKKTLRLRAFLFLVSPSIRTTLFLLFYHYDVIQSLSSLECRHAQ